MRRKQVLVSYVPTPHRGYVQFFRKYHGEVLYVLGPEIIAGFTSLVRNLPANTPEDVCKMIRALDIFSSVKLLNPETLHEVQEQKEVIMPDEDVSRELAEKYLLPGGTKVRFEQIWLRWHRTAVLARMPPRANRVISYDVFDRECMQEAYRHATRSSDWWRQVGALAVKDGRVLFKAFNEHQPSPHSPYVVGDPRSQFEAGQFIEMSSAGHAESNIIDKAARLGTTLLGASLYVTTFPCPPCALRVANAGFKKVYFADGYSLIAGDEILMAKGIEVVKVLLDSPPSS